MHCFYHANCNDGAAAAFAVWRKYGDEGHTYTPVQYGNPPPDMPEKGRELLAIVDFSYPREMLIDLSRHYERILVIDHHKTAKEQLIDLPGPIESLFDMEKCGATLVWEYLFPNEPIPLLFRYVQDRDLWRHSLPDTDAVAMGLKLYTDFRHLYYFVRNPNLASTRLSEVAVKGQSIIDYLAIQAEKIVATPPRLFPETGDIVPLYNLPGFMLSNTLHTALETYPDAEYAVGYFDLAEQRVFSLRSRPGSNVDVSAIAKARGGGGHKHAAGFKIDLL